MNGFRVWGLRRTGLKGFQGNSGLRPGETHAAVDISYCDLKGVGFRGFWMGRCAFLKGNSHNCFMNNYKE